MNPTAGFAAVQGGCSVQAKGHQVNWFPGVLFFYKD